MALVLHLIASASRKRFLLPLTDEVDAVLHFRVEARAVAELDRLVVKELGFIDGDLGLRWFLAKNTLSKWSVFGRLDPSYDRVGDGSPAAVAWQDDWCWSAIIRELNLDGFGRIPTGIVGIDTGHGEQDVGGFNLGRQLQ